MELQSLREEIDAIDTQLKALFAERMRISASIAQAKASSGKAVNDPSREREILNRLTEGETMQMQGYLKTLYTTIFNLSKSYQNSITHQESALSKSIKACIERFSRASFPNRATVAVQGVEGANSYQACQKLFTYPTMMQFRTFHDVFEAVEQGLCQYGILPIENNTAGSVNGVYELLQEHHCYIVRSLTTQINHHLMAKKGTTMEDVREILSHPQALSQCSKFLSELPSCTITPFGNTAMAAQQVQQSTEHGLAAICSWECAELYGLEVLRSNIADNDNNHTRFICISKALEVYPGADRSTFMLRLPHRAGTLYHILARFAALDINLTKLESRPIKGSDFEMLFYFDVDTSIYNDNLYRLIDQLEKEGVNFVYLGSYSLC